MCLYLHSICKAFSPHTFPLSTPANASFCFARYVISRVKTYLDNDPNATVISVTQNDGGGAGICHTPDEDAVTKEEGSPSGPLLRAVNAVADAIADDYPGVLVETLAYQCV